MNYFLDIPTFSRFYCAPDNKEDEKPPPDLKSTEARIEEREIKTGRRRGKQTPETIKERAPPADEAMGSVPRKEKSSWPDWQFWRRSKATGTGFTFRKDINDTAVRTNQPELPPNEHASSNDSVSVNVGVNHVGMAARKAGEGRHTQGEVATVRGGHGRPFGESELDKDDPLVSYKKEINGAKHVVINMEKIEAERRLNGELSPKPATSGGVTSSARTEKHLPEKLVQNTGSTPVRNLHVTVARSLGEFGAAPKVNETGRKPIEEVEEKRTPVMSNGFVQYRAEYPKIGPNNGCSRQMPTGQAVSQQSNMKTSNAPQKEHKESVRRKESEGNNMPQNATKTQKPAHRSAATLQPEPSKSTQGKI